MTRRISGRFLFSALVAGVSIPLAAATVTEGRIGALARLLPPKPITVGPYDQFQATVDPRGQYIVFTARAELVTRLRAEPRAGGEPSDLLPADADSRDAAFAPDGRMAFTYYRANARGDICVVPPAKISAGRPRPFGAGQIRCLPRADDDERSGPFWISGSELGYVRRDALNGRTRIVSQKLAGQSTTGGIERTLVEGSVWAPAMAAGGRYLVYDEISDGGRARGLALFDLENRSTVRPRLDIPGSPGFAAVSDDGRYVYVSYLDEAGAADPDGSESAHVFRFRVADAIAGELIEPEPLTPSELSCSYPKPGAGRLLVTCAAGGALGIYEFPETGALPPGWDGTKIEDAIRAARSYSQRVFLLDALAAHDPASAAGLAPRRFSAHLLDEDFGAARFYLKDLGAMDPGRKALLQIYLSAQIARRAQPAGPPTREFSRTLTEWERAAGRARGQNSFLSRVIIGGLRSFGENGARSDFEKLKYVPGDPLAAWLYARLAEDVLAGSRAAPRLRAAYRALALDPGLPPESQTYYVARALALIAGSGAPAPERQTAVAALGKGLPPAGAELVAAELEGIAIAAAADPAIKQKLFVNLERRLRAAGGRSALRRALNVRAVANFSARADFAFLEAVAANWLRDVAKDDPEFAFARDAVTDTALDEAYAYFGRGDFLKASGFFYSALSLTDDLEAHAGYLRSEIERGAAAGLGSRYAFLETHALIGESREFVRALGPLLERKKTGGADPLPAELDRAYRQVASMGGAGGSALPALLLGYADLVRERQMARGREFDPDRFARAHRELMIALDGGRENDRVRAAALMDLGLLHERAGNFGLAARFWGLRKLIGFESPGARRAFAWAYARALAHTNQFSLAAAELGEIAEEPAALERRALYVALAGRYDEAIALYDRLWPTLPTTDRFNRAKIGLGRGYAQFKAGRMAAAKTSLRGVLADAEGLKMLPIDRGRAIAFDPRRIRLAALGLLASTGDGPERRTALLERARALENADALVENAETERLRVDLQIAALDDSPNAEAHLSRALRRARDLGRDNGYVGQPLTRTLVDALAFALARGRIVEGDRALVGDLAARALAAMPREPLPPVDAAIDYLKLQVLWERYKFSLLGTATARDLAGALDSPLADLVRRESPERWLEIGRLARVPAR